MTRGYQIWSQNLNRTSFDPLFGPKTVENCQNRDFPELSNILKTRANWTKLTSFSNSATLNYPRYSLTWWAKKTLLASVINDLDLLNSNLQLVFSSTLYFSWYLKNTHFNFFFIQKSFGAKKIFGVHVERDFLTDSDRFWSAEFKSEVCFFLEAVVFKLWSII